MIKSCIIIDAVKEVLNKELKNKMIMNKKEGMVAKIKIRVDYDNETHNETEYVLPAGVVNDILCYIFQWESKYETTYKDLKKYQQAEKAYRKKLKAKK